MLTFAWIDDHTVAFDPVAHQVQDELIIHFQRTLVEGEVPSAIAVIQNPYEGLLSTGRKQWAWVGYVRADNVHVPLFKGRAYGVPESIVGQTLTIQLLAEHPDVETLKEGVANTLRVLPYWDIAFISPDNRIDPDYALEGRTVSWHYDHLTLAVGVSDWVNGEDGTVIINSGVNVPHDSLIITPNPSIHQAIKVEVWGYWNQRAKGTVDLTQAILAAAGEPYIKTFTGFGLYESWPVPDQNIGSGWIVSDSSLTYVSQDDLDVEVYQLVAPTENNTTTIKFDEDGFPIPPSDDEKESQTEDQLTNDFFAQPRTVTFFSWKMVPVFKVRYEAERERIERVRFTLWADVQKIRYAPGNEPTQKLTIACENLGERVDPNPLNPDRPNRPIGDPKRRQYFPTDRGRLSLDFALRIAACKLVYRARSVEVTFKVPFEVGIDITTRKNVQLFDERIPGGSCVGKVVGASLTLNAQSGDTSCTVKISCLAGTGVPADSPVVQPNDYIAADYIEAGHFGSATPGSYLSSFNIVYPDISNIPPNDDGIDFFNMTPDTVLDVTKYPGGILIENLGPEQSSLLTSEIWKDGPTAIEQLNTNFTKICVNLKPLQTGPHQTNYNLGRLRLPLSKQIDLTAGP